MVNRCPTVSTCNFKTIKAGTLAFDRHGNKIGFYETEDAAVEVIREIEKNGGKGGNDDAI